jgi:hypothetical protein
VRRLLTHAIHDVTTESLRLLTVGRVADSLTARVLLGRHSDLDIDSVFMGKVFRLTCCAETRPHHSTVLIVGLMLLIIWLIA